MGNICPTVNEPELSGPSLEEAIKNRHNLKALIGRNRTPEHLIRPVKSQIPKHRDRGADSCARVRLILRLYVENAKIANGAMAVHEYP